MDSQQSLLATPVDPAASGSQRSPLATLSFSDPSHSSPVGPGPLRRLRRRSQSPSERAAESSTKKRRNVFDDLKQGAQAEAERKRRRLEKSDFVEQEAHESDDEGGFWGRGKKTDDDEDMGDEDLDKTLEGLVDDQVMDDDTLAEQRVLEKFKLVFVSFWHWLYIDNFHREQAAQDDQRIEQKANDIVQGEWRKKHKDGGFMSDDSDDEMDDDARRARRRLRRERMKREDVEAMGGCYVSCMCLESTCSHVSCRGKPGDKGLCCGVQIYCRRRGQRVRASRPG
jgi:mediator of replication checkpoint protein 1